MVWLFHHNCPKTPGSVLYHSFITEICHFRNEKKSGASIISQLLLKPFLGKMQLLNFCFVSTNGPWSECEMRIVPDFASSSKWRDFVSFYTGYLLYTFIGCLLFLRLLKLKKMLTLEVCENDLVRHFRVYLIKCRKTKTKVTFLFGQSKKRKKQYR